MPNCLVIIESVWHTPGISEIAELISFTVFSSQELSTILSKASLNISKAALRMNRQITILAIGSRTGKPSRAPSIPINAPTDDNASERWCHASAMRAPEFIFFAPALVYQNMPSLTTMETMAAISARIPGTLRSP